MSFVFRGKMTDVYFIVTFVENVYTKTFLSQEAKRKKREEENRVLNHLSSCCISLQRRLDNPINHRRR